MPSTSRTVAIMPIQSTSANAQSSSVLDPRLEAVFDAHGGLASWAGVTAIEGQLSCGGFALASRLQRRALRRLRFRVEPHARRVTLRDFGRLGWVGTWSPAGVSLRDGNGLVGQRPDARAHFDRWASVIAWDRLDVLYFAGYALWNYLSFPFLLGQPGVTVSFDDRRLVVDFPPDLPTHSPRQAFHLDVHGHLLRHDYTAEVYGRWAHVANLVRGATVAGGHRFYTRRRAWARLGSGSAIVPWPLIIWIELDDLVVVREEGATP